LRGFSLAIDAPNEQTGNKYSLITSLSRFAIMAQMMYLFPNDERLKDFGMSQMNKSITNDTPLITIGQVNQMQVDLAAKLQERETLDAAIKRLETWLAAASLLAGHDLAAMEKEVELDELNDGVINEVENMAEATKRILAASTRAISHAQLQDALRETPLFAERLEKNPNYYYTMVSRLIKRGEVERFRKLLRMPKEKVEIVI
jgi:hypothetical protein